MAAAAAAACARPASATPDSIYSPGFVPQMGSQSFSCIAPGGHPAALASPSTLGCITQRLWQICSMPTSTAHGQRERMQLMRATHEATTSHAEALAILVVRALHEQRDAAYPLDSDRSLLLLEHRLQDFRGDDSLRVVALGKAGGIKVEDTANGLFCKASMELDRIYKGSATMAAKAAAREVSTIGHLHAAEQSRLVMVPLAWCIDVTAPMPAGRAPRVYRVQVLSHHNLSEDTIRHGSCDGGRTLHACPTLDGVVDSLALSLHLGRPEFATLPEQPLTSVHSYEQRSAEAGGLCGPADVKVYTQLLSSAMPESLGARRSHEDMEACTLLSNPLEFQCAHHTVENRRHALGPLPFDVEVHVLPCGSMMAVDLHRLGIPEATAVPTLDMRLAVVWVRRPPGATESCSQVVKLTNCARLGTVDLAKLAARQAELEDPFGVSWSELSLDCRQGREVAVSLVRRSDDGVRVLLPDPTAYWQAPYLTALLRPEAAGILRQAGKPTVSPDDALPASKVVTDSRKEATSTILGETNLHQTAGAVARSVMRLGTSGNAAFKRFRVACKACLHKAGLGLRHSWAVLSLLLPSKGASGDSDLGAAPHAEQLQQALVSMSLPSPRSPAAAALCEFLLAGQAGTDLASMDDPDADWVACALTARAVACKGPYTSTEDAEALASVLLAAPPASFSAWLKPQQVASGEGFSARVKTSGVGATRAQVGADMTGDSDDCLQASRLATLDCLHLRLLLAEDGHSEAIVHDLNQLAHVLGRLPNASCFQMRALLAALARSSLKDQPEQWTSAVETLALRLFALGKLPEAELLLDHALRAERPASGVNLQIAVLQRCKARCLLANSHIPEALRLLNHCDGLLGDVGSQGKTEQVVVMCAQASCQIKLGHFEIAKDWLNAAESKFADAQHDHPGLAWPLLELGKLHVALEEDEKAVEIFGRCERCLQQSLRKHHPRVAIAQTLKAKCLWRMGNCEDAVEAQRQAVAIQRKTLDFEDQKRKAEVAQLREWLEASGKYDAAVALLKHEHQAPGAAADDSVLSREAEEELKRVTKERDFAGVAETMLQSCRRESRLGSGQGAFEAEAVLLAMASADIRSGRSEAATRALTVFRSLQTAFATEAGSAALATMDMLSEASDERELYRLLAELQGHLATFREQHGSKHVSNTCILRSIGRLRMRLRHWPEATEALSRCRAIWSTEYPSLDEPIHVVEMFDLALLLTKQGDFSKAQTAFADCERLERRLDAHSGRLAEIGFAHAGCFFADGRVEAAKNLLEKYVKDAEAHTTPDSFLLAGAHRRLQLYCQCLGLAAEAATHAARCKELRPSGDGGAAATAASSART